MRDVLGNTLKLYDVKWEYQGVIFIECWGNTVRLVKNKKIRTGIQQPVRIFMKFPIVFHTVL